MRVLLVCISCLGLILTVVPSFFVLTQQMAWTLHVQLMFAGMILWFGTAPFWMNKEETT